MMKKPKIRKYNKKLKKIDDEETIFALKEELTIKSKEDNEESEW